jgi:hypothetical protein
LPAIHSLGQDLPGLAINQKGAERGFRIPAREFDRPPHVLFVHRRHDFYCPVAMIENRQNVPA